jgi:hypothetical protein
MEERRQDRRKQAVPKTKLIRSGLNKLSRTRDLALTRRGATLQAN